MATDELSDLPGGEAHGDGPALWGRAWRSTRPLAIDSASYYAQENGLTFDFYTESSNRAAAYLVSLKEEHPPKDKDQRLTSCAHLAQCTIPAPGISDCWVDAEPTVEYLQHLHSPLEGHFSGDTHISEPKYTAVKSSRCENPILRSDNNLDLLDLAGEIYRRRAIPSVGTEIPLVETDSSGDGGLQFPCFLDQLKKHFDNYLSKEGIHNVEDTQISGDSSFYGVSDVANPGKELINGLIDLEYMRYKKSRV